MERRKLAAVCGAALCFWLFALAVGTSQGVGLNTAFHTSPMNAALVSAPAPAAAPAQEGALHRHHPFLRRTIRYRNRQFIIV